MFFGWYVVAGTFVAQMFVLGFFTYSELGGGGFSVAG